MNFSQVDFHQKIKELDFIHQRVNAERSALENRMKIDKEFKQAFYNEKAEQVKKELARLETYKVKLHARNQALKSSIAKTAEAFGGKENSYLNGFSIALQHSKQRLSEAKHAFINEMQRRDSTWMEKVRQRTQADIARMELAQENIQREVNERQRAFEVDQIQNSELLRAKDEFIHQQNRLLSIDRQRKEQAIEAQQMFLEQQRLQQEKLDEIRAEISRHTTMLEQQRIDIKVTRMENQEMRKSKTQQEIEWAIVDEDAHSAIKARVDRPRSMVEQAILNHGPEAAGYIQSEGHHQVIRNTESPHSSAGKSHSNSMIGVYKKEASKDQVERDFEDLLNRSREADRQIKANSATKQVSPTLIQSQNVNQTHSSHNRSAEKQHGLIAAVAEWDNADDTPQSNDNISPGKDSTYIRLSKDQRIDEDLERVSISCKAIFAASLSDYIKAKMDSHFSLAASKPLFEKPREIAADRKMKYLLIEKYNELGDNFAWDHSLTSLFDVGIPCDLLFDLMRYENSDIMDVQKVCQEFNMKGSSFQINDFYKTVHDAYYIEIIKLMVKLISRAKNNNMFDQQMAVCRNFAEAIVSVDQGDFKSELAQLISHIIDKTDGSASRVSNPQTFVTGDKTFADTLKAEKVHDVKPSPQKVSNQTVTLSDEARIEICEELKEHLDAEIKKAPSGGSMSAFSNPQSIIELVESKKIIGLLNKWTSGGEEEFFKLPVEQKTPTLTALMIMLLQSRQEQNVDKSALSYCEESGDFSEFAGFFSNKTAKTLFGALIKVFAEGLQKKLLKQKDAEMLILAAVINFECSQVEIQLIKQCIVDSLTSVQAMGRSSASASAGLKLGGNISSTGSYNAQFVGQETSQQQFVGKQKSKLKSSLKSNSNIPATNTKGATEFDYEIVDEF